MIADAPVLSLLQLPYEMGSTAAQVLYNYMRDGELKDFYYETNIVSYNLIPLELPPADLDENLIGNFKYLGFSCFGVVVLSAVACICWTFYLRKSMVVKAAQPFFLVMVASGVLVMSSTLVPLSFEDDGDTEHMMSAFHSVAICQSIPWLGFTGFTITFSALFAKTWRVNKLFRANMEHARIQVSEKDVLGPFVLLMTCNIIVLVCWTIIDPLTYVREESVGTDYWNRVISSYGACRSDNAVAYLVPLAVLNFAVVAVACYQAHQARDVQAVFSEAKYITLTVTSLFQAFSTGIPVVVVVRDLPVSYYLVLTIMIFVLCMGILALIFLPKVMMHRNYSEMTPVEQNRKIARIIRESSQRLSINAERQKSSRNWGSTQFSSSNKLNDGFSGELTGSFQDVLAGFARPIPEPVEGESDCSMKNEDVRRDTLYSEPTLGQETRPESCTSSTEKAPADDVEKSPSPV